MTNAPHPRRGGELDAMVTVEDTGGAEIDTAAMAHLSLSTPEERRLHAIAFHEWVTVRTADNAPPVTGSRMGVPGGPGARHRRQPPIDPARRSLLSRNKSPRRVPRRHSAVRPLSAVPRSRARNARRFT